MLSNKSLFVRISSESFMKAFRACFETQTQLDVIPHWGGPPSFEAYPAQEEGMEWTLSGAVLVGKTESSVDFCVVFREQRAADLLRNLETRLGIGARLNERGESWRLSEVWSDPPEEVAVPESLRFTNGIGLPPWGVLLEYTIDAPEPCADN